MRQELKTRWIENLRSGRFEQAVGTLNDGEGGYCCLGVLCETMIEMGAPVEQARTGGARMGYRAIGKEFVCIVYPSKDILTLAGLTEDGEDGDAFHVHFDQQFVDDHPDRVLRERNEHFASEDDWNPLEFSDDLATLNDDGYTFKEIADLIERQL